MYCNSTYRIVNMKLIIQKPYTKYYQKSCYCTDHDSAEAVSHITRSGNRYQTCQRCIQTHGYIRFAIFDPGKYHTYYSCDCGSYGSGKEHGA